jgi:ZIP family zinc transporter
MISWEAVGWGTLGGAISGGATAIGTLLFLIPPRKSFNIENWISFEFALGMMLAASVFSLVLPSITDAMLLGTSAVQWALISIFVGLVFILGVGHAISIYPRLRSDDPRAMLFIIAMMLHNLPEGIAPGAALAGTSSEAAWPILSAVALQNLPEGFTTALAFRALGASRAGAAIGSFASGLVELFGGVMGGALVGSVHGILPLLLGFAGGAMLTVSIKETWERLRSGVSWKQSIPRLLAGFALMMVMAY